MDPISKHELIVDQSGKLRHTRTGQIVTRLVLRGNKANGNPATMSFAATMEGWYGFQSIPLREPKYTILLATGDEYKLDMKGPAQ